MEAVASPMSALREAQATTDLRLGSTEPQTAPSGAHVADRALATLVDLVLQEVGSLRLELA